MQVWCQSVGMMTTSGVITQILPGPMPPHHCRHTEKASCKPARPLTIKLTCHPGHQLKFLRREAQVQEELRMHIVVPAATVVAACGNSQAPVARPVTSVLAIIQHLSLNTAMRLIFARLGIGGCCTYMRTFDCERSCCIVISLGSCCWDCQLLFRVLLCRSCQEGLLSKLRCRCLKMKSALD